ncbi:MAG: DUF2237 domain-containing protein [Alphaproteobacteria bacterium]|jgi:uncharacterized protein (DUF2237 family)|nr:DUF2237 domain-containing protein [Alphaproteobacteria bacterium]
MDGSQGRPDGQKNVLGGRLESCSHDPVTGFFRDGCCNTGPQDSGLHTVCAVMSDSFLGYSKSVGNDLSTPMPDFGFAGLKDGDQWCLCAARWEQARQAGHAPKVRLQATNMVTLAVCSLDDLKAHAIDLM